MVERRQRANHAAHDCHRVRIAAEPAIKRHQLFVQHGVAGDCVGKIVEIVLARQFAIEQQVAHFHEAGIFSQLADRITAVQQHALITVDIGQRAFAARGRGESRVESERAGLRIQLADIDHVRAGAAFEHVVFERFSAQIEFRQLVCHDQSPVLIPCPCRRFYAACLTLPGRRAGPELHPVLKGPEHRKYRVRWLSRSAPRASAAPACQGPIPVPRRALL